MKLKLHNYFRILKWVTEEDGLKETQTTKGRVQAVILEMTSEYQNSSFISNTKHSYICIHFFLLFISWIYEWMTYIIFFIDLMNVDTSGIIVLEELHKRLLSRGIKVSFLKTESNFKTLIFRKNIIFLSNSLLIQTSM